MAKPLELRPGHFNRGRDVSNRGLHLRILPIGQGPSHSLCVGMRTHVPVGVGPNSPLGSWTMVP